MKRTLSLTLILLTFVLYIFSKTASAEYYVRTIYFHPSDIPPHANSISTLRSLVDSTKQFFADEMANHGFGSKTFTTETDTSGNTLVHTVTGKSTNTEYAAGTGDITQEVGEMFDLSLNVVYLIWTDIDYGAPPNNDYSTLSVGGWGSGNSFSGSAQVSGARVHIANEISHVYDRTLVGIAHELGHTFGLPHDFRDDYYIMSYGNPINKDQLSFCSAKWLDASRYFNSSQTSSDPFSATISMSTLTLVSAPNTIRFSFQVTDSDGLHQAVLLSEFTDGGGVVDCKSLSGDSATIEFDTTEIGTANTYVALLVMDVQGNFTSKTFLIDVSSILTVTGNAEIPDKSLAESIRKSLNLASNATITKQKMWELRTFTAKGATGFINDPIGIPITDLTGLEHAINLESINISNHSVSSLLPMSGLTKLKTMIAGNNEISNISSLAGLTQLDTLHLTRNQISDITSLAGLTRLTVLDLSNNQIVDIGPLRTLTNLSQLYLTNNQISDVSPLSGLTSLLTLSLLGNLITDQTPLETLKNQNPELQITIDEAPVVTNNPPVFSDGISTARLVPENTEVGTNIGAPVTATDPDTRDTLTYTLEGTDKDAFDIDRATGQLKTKADVELDFETKPSYTITVTATDTGGLTTTITVNINLQNIDEAVDNNPPVFSDSSVTRLVPEGVDAGTNIGDPVTAIDPDTGDTLTYSLGGTDKDAFVIDNETGQLKTKAGVELDFETKPSYTITVTATDSEGLTATITVNINLQDVNETADNNPPVFSDSSITRLVPEDVSAGTNIGDPVTAIDPDTGDTLTYSLGGTDKDAFVIDNETGQLKTKAGVELDFETKPSYTITVTATDSEGLTATITVNINLQDIDEAVEVEIITIPDENLASAIRETLSLEVDADITQSDMEQLESLSATNQEITDLTGLEYAINLQNLVLTDNQISDIRPLSGLITLVELSLQDNHISDVTPLAGLINLDRLDLVGNPITNREPLLTLLRNNRNVKIYLKNESEPLPVTLSYFRAEHTDAGVKLKWITESEVDNAGFYIYRSETRHGEFKVVNPTMIQGAGTTGERHKYTWTDTTAKLNTIYYYRIKDVSHAGEREQLATVRLRGLVSASGKLITRWAVLKGKR